MTTDQTRIDGPRPFAPLLLTAAALVLCAASAWDAVGRLFSTPAWWPVPGYVGVGVGVALGSVAVLLDTLLTARPQRRPRLSLLCMVALGVTLGAWLLRGHHEIPADPPIVFVQLVAAVVILLAALSRR